MYHTVPVGKRAQHPLHRKSGAGGTGEPRGDLTGADYFIPNETEAEAITGLPVRTRAGGGCHRPPQQRFPPGGAHTRAARRYWLAELDGHVHVPPFAVSAVDTTGAGDAFIGSLAVFLAEGLPEKDAVARASLYAALSTTRVGTQKSFPRRTEFAAEWAARGR